MEAATSAVAEEVQWTWKREAPQTKTVRIRLFSKRAIVEQIATELNLIGNEVYQEFRNSCFGFLMQFDTQGAACCTALHCLFTREVIKADASPDELWYRVGGRFIRFSKYEYALVTGLSFGPSTFDPSAEHHPPASGIFLRHYGGRRLRMVTLLRDFTDGVFRESPAEALKVAKLLTVYFLLFGMDGFTTYIDEWAWTLIEDSDGWETFMWGKYTYQILLTYLKRLPTEFKQFKAPSYRVYGFVWAFLIWAFEAIPELGNAFAVPTSDNVLPRCLRWRFLNSRVHIDSFYDRKMEVQSMLEPSAQEQRQPYWEHIHEDQSGVSYIHRVYSQEIEQVSNSQVSKVTPTRHPSSTFAKPMKLKKKRKRTNPLTTTASHRDEIPKRSARGLMQKKLPALVRQEQPPVIHLTIMELPGMKLLIVVWPRPIRYWGPKSSRCPQNPVKVFNHRKEDALEANCSHLLNTDEIRNIEKLRTGPDFFMDSKPELSSVAVDQAGNKSIFELNEKMNELNQNLENELLMRVYQEKCKRLDIKIGKMGKEIEELRYEKLAAIRTAEELRLKQLKSDKVVEELKFKNVEDNRKKMESDKAVKLYKRRLENLLSKIMKIEKGENLDSQNLMGEKYNSGNCSSPEDAENVVVMSRGAYTKSSGLSKKGNITTELNGLSDGASTDDSDDSCTDSKMDDLITSLHSKKLSRKWTYEADMLRSLQQDEQLCMSAVCALYRQHVVARKSKGHSKNGGFGPFDSMSGCALAEYLIDGDKELRPRKPVSEVMKQCPDVISQCRKLATINVEKLFQIYCAADDPFFGKS